MFRNSITSAFVAFFAVVLPSMVSLANPLASATAQELISDELHQMIPANNDYTYFVALGDVDGDGDLDALIGNAGLYVGSQNRLYLNDGAGVFSDATSQLPEDSDFTDDKSCGVFSFIEAFTAGFYSDDFYVFVIEES